MFQTEGSKLRMIKFNKPPYEPEAIEYIKDTIKNEHICGDGVYTKKCTEWLMDKTKAPKILLTTSCTHALEMAALLLHIGPEDEVIMPSYTFASTADAFAIRGAKIVFVDIHPETMNIDERLIENAITEKTKVIVAVHYAGVACEMDKIINIAEKYNLYVVEDAAQGVMSTYRGRSLGTFGVFGCYSFHETKNYSMGEGGAIVINNPDFIELAEILREKGTNRSKFWRGEVDKYTWLDLGSSYLPSELNSAYLWSQLERAEIINDKRLALWKQYHEGLWQLKLDGIIDLPKIIDKCEHNAHMYYIKTRDIEERSMLISFLKERGIGTAFHYIPLHMVPAGIKYGTFRGKDQYTTCESERLLRLPMYNDLRSEEVDVVVSAIYEFYSKRMGTIL